MQGAMFARPYVCAVKEVVPKAVDRFMTRSNNIGAAPFPISSSSCRSSWTAKTTTRALSLSALNDEESAVVETETSQVAIAQLQQPQASRSRKRHRHRFTNVTDDIPSFQEFQQQQQVRSLYRKFTRLVVRQTPAAVRPQGTSSDLQRQIRHEFRLPAQDSWHVKRSMSEGNRRYKELASMLGSTVLSAANEKNSRSDNNHTHEASLVAEPSVPSSATGNWPWNRPNPTGRDTNGLPGRPLPFPRKSNL